MLIIYGVPLNDQVTKGDICGKPIRLVKRHNFAIIPWAEARQQHGCPLNLISLDYHSDDCQAFRDQASFQVKKEASQGLNPEVSIEEVRESIIAELDPSNPESVIVAAKILDHDEQIDAAVRAKIFERATVICHQKHSDRPVSRERIAADIRFDNGEFGFVEPTRPFTYQRAVDGIYVPAPRCYVGCRAKPHNEGCRKLLADDAIESVYLERQLTTASRMAGCDPWDPQYVLDIDVDYFRSWRALDPHCTDLFDRLVRDACLITIALEYKCLENGWIGSSPVDCERVLKTLLDHITRALSQTM